MKQPAKRQGIYLGPPMQEYIAERYGCIENLSHSFNIGFERYRDLVRLLRPQFSVEVWRVLIQALQRDRPFEVDDIHGIPGGLYTYLTRREVTDLALADTLTSLPLPALYAIADVVERHGPQKVDLASTRKALADG